MLYRIASFWDGKAPLHYLHHLCLKSFVDHGHEVTLYTLDLGEKGLAVPEGVNVLPASEVMGAAAERLPKFEPATASDLFRILLNSSTEQIWVDTDMLCLKPFEIGNGYEFANEGDGRGNSSERSFNNAVLRLPENSEALELLRQNAYFVLDMSRQNLDPRVVKFQRSRKYTHPILKHGPRALSHYLSITGEYEHRSPTAKFYPIHFNLGDLFWDNQYDIATRFDDTSCVHLWHSQIRRGWLKRMPPEGSFIERMVERHDLDVEAILKG